MVLETIKVKWIEHRPYIALLFGFCYTFIGYFAAYIFFRRYISIAMLFLSTLLIVPSLMKLLEIEEKRESRYGLRNFLKEHKDVIEAYAFLFLGIFIGYLILGLVVSYDSYMSVFEFQRNFLINQEGLSGDVIKTYIAAPFEPAMKDVLSLVTNNLLLCIILFILSFFYGAGAIFLVVLNASIFASFVTYMIHYVAQKVSTAFAVIGIFCIHMIPESLGFLLAAIAGGVVSKALMREKIGGKGFSNVIQDSTMLLFISCLLIIAAAFLEVYVTPFFFKMLG